MSSSHKDGLGFAGTSGIGLQTNLDRICDGGPFLSLKMSCFELFDLIALVDLWGTPLKSKMSPF